jgi:predicted NBD/HSP70 family sugar kinase
MDGIGHRAEAGDPTALEALTNAGRALGVALSGAINFIDVGTVVLGGDFATLMPHLLPALRAELERRVLTWGWAAPDQAVRGTAAGPLPALTGAALTSIDPVAADPEAYLS